MKRCDHCGQPMPNQHGVICNDDSRCILYDGRCSDTLTAHEYALVKYLVSRFDRYCTVEQVGDQLYQLSLDPPECMQNTLSTFASRARRKLAPIGLLLAPSNRGGLGWKITRAPDSYQTSSSAIVHSSAH